MLGLEHPGFKVSDLERSIEFYEKIGFKVLRKTTTPHAMMYLGTDILEITQGLKDKDTPFRFHLALHTDDIEGEVARLRGEGIEIGEIMRFTGKVLDKTLSGVVQYADPVPDDRKLTGCMQPSENWKRVAFKDPEGVSIEIWQRN